MNIRWMDVAINSYVQSINGVSQEKKKSYLHANIHIERALYTPQVVRTHHSSSHVYTFARSEAAHITEQSCGLAIADELGTNTVSRRRLNEDRRCEANHCPPRLVMDENTRTHTHTHTHTHTQRERERERYIYRERERQRERVSHSHTQIDTRTRPCGFCE